MAKEDNNTTMDSRVPTILTLRDVFLMLAAVVSIMVAWGMFGTRLSVVEERLISVKSNVSEIRQLILNIRDENKQARHDKHSGVVRELEIIEQRIIKVEENYDGLNRMLHHDHE